MITQRTIAGHIVEATAKEGFGGHWYIEYTVDGKTFAVIDNHVGNRQQAYESIQTTLNNWSTIAENGIDPFAI